MPPDHESTELVAERPNALEARSISTKPQVDTTAALLGAEPPWLPPPAFGRIDWDAFAVYPNHLAAQIVVGLLENEGLAAIVTAWTAFPGVASATLWVPKHLMHRARWIVALGPPSDAELLLLATGELSSNDGRHQP